MKGPPPSYLAINPYDRPLDLMSVDIPHFARHVTQLN